MPRPRQPRPPVAEPVGLRIIGGAFRGRTLRYSGEIQTRPMKDRVREAVFNLLADSVKGVFALDLFAGTGALGLEALSRGAARALFLERRLPAVEIIRQNLATLEATERGEVRFGDTFLWGRNPVCATGPLPQSRPWIVFCSPPYDFYRDRQADLLALLGRLLSLAPPDSSFVVECDERFDPALLPQPEVWDVRTYSPAVIAWMTTPLCPSPLCPTSPTA